MWSQARGSRNLSLNDLSCLDIWSILYELGESKSHESELTSSAGISFKWGDETISESNTVWGSRWCLTCATCTRHGWCIETRGNVAYWLVCRKIWETYYTAEKDLKNMPNPIRSSALPTDLKADVWLLASFLSSLVSGLAQGGLQAMYLSLCRMPAGLSDTCGLYGLGFMRESSSSLLYKLWPFIQLDTILWEVNRFSWLHDTGSVALAMSPQQPSTQHLSCQTTAKQSSHSYPLCQCPTINF